MLEQATILVGTDLTEHSTAAVEAASAIAKRFGARRLVLVHGVRDAPFAGLGEGAARALGRAQMSTEALRAQVAREMAEEGSAVNVTSVVRSGRPAQVLVESAEEQSAALVVVSSHGYGSLRRALVGSVAAETVRAARCPVLVVGPHRSGRGRIEAITAAVDLSPVSERVLASAVAFGSAYDAPVRAITVCEAAGLLVSDVGGFPGATPGEIDIIRAEQREGLAKLATTDPNHGVEVEAELLEGAYPPDVILQDVARTAASLVVVGTSGQDAWHRFVLGSTADHVLSEAPCPVLVVPFASPALEPSAV